MIKHGFYKEFPTLTSSLSVNAKEDRTSKCIICANILKMLMVTIVALLKRRKHFHSPLSHSHFTSQIFRHAMTFAVLIGHNEWNELPSCAATSGKYVALRLVL